MLGRLEQKIHPKSPEKTRIAKAYQRALAMVALGMFFDRGRERCNKWRLLISGGFLNTLALLGSTRTGNELGPYKGFASNGTCFRSLL